MRELHTFSTPGQTLYAVLLDDLGKVWNLTLSDWEELDAENWGDYDVQFTEAIAGIYLADAPFAASRYYGCVYRQVGATPDINDTLRMVINTVLASADDAVLLAISALNNLSAAGAQAAAAAALAAYDAATGSDVPSAAEIADAVCDEALAGHTNPGSVGAAIAAAVDPMTAPMGGYDEGTAGYEIHELYEQVTAVLPDYPSVTVPAPPTAEQSTAWIRCLSQAGAPEAGVTITVRLVSVDAGVDAYDMAPATGTSDASGLATITIPRGAQCLFEARRGGTGRWVRFRGANEPTVLLPSVLGSP